MLYENYNSVDEARRSELNASALRYVQRMLGVLGSQDDQTKADLLIEWYNTMILISIDPNIVHHELYRKTPEAQMCLSLLILEIEIHRICRAVAREMGINFGSNLSTGHDCGRTENSLKVLLGQLD